MGPSDDIILGVIYLIVYAGVMIPLIFVPLILWTRLTRFARFFQLIGLLLVLITFLGSLIMSLFAFTGFTSLTLVPTLTSFIALVGILIFKKENPKTVLFLKIISFLFILSFLYLLYIAIYPIWKARRESSANINNTAYYPKNTPTPTSVTDTWTTYSSKDVGYLIKYPTDWSLEVIDKTADTYGQVKYIILKTADKKFALTFGVKKLSSNFSTTDRTGIGADKTTPEYNWSTKLFNTTIIPDALGYSGKTKEFMFAENETTQEQCQCKFNIFYGPLNPTDAEYEALDLAPSVLEIPDKIISTFRWL